MTVFGYIEGSFLVSRTGDVFELGIRMLTLDTKMSLYTEDRGLKVPMTLLGDEFGSVIKS